jgi:redox-sensitive bicupin YhaK (pirin superfamily)
VISIFPYSELGNHNYGWLDAHYHFNFAEYYHPDKSGYQPLLVWNDDCIQPGTGFPMHSHRDMEIITYIRQGAITHEDSLGNKGVTKAGEIQIMSAGTGITHSEYNHEDVETLLFQIWIHPNENNIQPRWENVAINSFHELGIHILASGEKELENSNIIKLFQDATLYLINGEQEKDLDFELKNGRQMYLVVAKGAVMINENRVNSRDGVFINNENKLDFNFQEDSELLFFDLPAINT